MADVINLKQTRKAKARLEKEKQAAQNRALHGQTKAEKQKRKREAEKAARSLDGHKLDPKD